MTRDRTDIMAELLRRFALGLVRPLWADLAPERRVKWMHEARIFIARAEEAGLRIEEKVEAE